ncbi:MAG: hypothetical protein KMY54_08745 [Erysipelothrix sp.]|nr:hypothetical protein [Erysipelothrix sp.]
MVTVSDQRGRPHLHIGRIAQRVKGEAIAETVAGDGGQLIAGIAVIDNCIATAYGSQFVIIGVIRIRCCDTFDITTAVEINTYSSFSTVKKRIYDSNYDPS